MYIAESDTIDVMHNGEVQSFGEGLYFGLDESVYHRIPALSSTGLKNLLISAPDFYFNSELNPLREEDAEDEDAKEWRVFGKASHTRILEGKEIFDSLYCVEFIAPEGCLDTISDLKKALDDMGVPSQSKWKKADYIAAVLNANPNALIYDNEREKYYRETGGRIQLTQKEMRRIEIAAAMIEHHPELKHCFTGGHPEVTVIWRATVTIDNKPVILWFKARLDYLKPQAIVDLKTFTNMRNKPIDQALHDVVENMKYHIQTAFYLLAGQAAIVFAKRGMVAVYTKRCAPTAGFLQALLESNGHQFVNVFQKKGGAPLARGKYFSPKLKKLEEARDYIDHAIKLFCKYYAQFGNELWVDDSSITEFVDDEFPARRINPF